MIVGDTEHIRSDDVRTKVKTIPPPPPPLLIPDTMEDNVTDTSSSSATSSPSSKSISCHYHKFSTFDSPPLSSETTTYKSTHSNVMCVSNSGSWTKNDHDGRRFHHSKHDPTKRIERQQQQQQQQRRQLYESIYSNNDGKNQPQNSRQHKSKNNSNNNNNNSKNRERSRHSIAQEKINEKELASSLRQRKIDRELHDEHRTFMTNLQRERKDKFEIEKGAAIRIQSFLRGVYVRQFLDGNRTVGMFRGYFRKTHPPSEDEIWQVMLDAAVKVGIQPEEEMLFGFKVPPQFQHYMVQSDDELRETN